MANQWLSRLRGTMGSIFGVGGTGGVNIKNNSGELQIRNAADSAHAPISASSLRVKDSGSANQVIFNAPTLGANVTYTLPDDDGTPGQFLQTNGSGVLDWVDSVSNADVEWAATFTEADAGTIAMFTPPANCTIKRVQVIVTVAAGGGSPTLEIGVAGTTNRYLTTSENDLKTAALYEVAPLYDEDGTPEAIIGTLVASSQTFTFIVHVTYGNPT